MFTSQLPYVLGNDTLHSAVVEQYVDIDDSPMVIRPCDETLTGDSLLALYALFANNFRSREQSRSVFIIDSGASAHMTPLRTMLVDVISRTGLVVLGDKSVELEILAGGHSLLPELGPFLWVPRLTFTLISIPALDRLGFRTVFQDGEAFVTFNDRLVLLGVLRDGLYHLHPDFVEQLTGMTESDRREWSLGLGESSTTISASALSRRGDNLRGTITAGERKRFAASLAFPTSLLERNVVEGTCARGSIEVPARCYGYRGVTSAPLCLVTWNPDGGGNEVPARGHASDVN